MQQRRQNTGKSAQGTDPKVRTNVEYTETLHLENGPLRVAMHRRKQRTHRITNTDRAVGCGWKYLKRTGQLISDKIAYAAAITDRHTMCGHCFAAYVLPLGWGTADDQQEAADEDSDPSESWASDSSQSGLEDTS